MVLICDRIGFGPRCSPSYLETTPVEEYDCLQRALYSCAENFEACKAWAFKNRTHLLNPRPDQDGFTSPGCANESDCYNWDCLYAIKHCFCLGDEGLVCISCNTTPPPGGGFSQFATEELEASVPPPKESVTKTRAFQVPLTSSAYGEIIPIVYGNVILGGNIIWCSDPHAEDVAFKDAIAAPIIQSKTFVDIEIGVSAGDLSGITRMWFDDTLVLDLTGVSDVPLLKKYADFGMTIEVYTGSETQKVSQVSLPFGKVPAYRGLAYIMIRNYPAVIAGGKIPTIRVEVASEITNSQIDVDTSSLGYTLDAQTFSVDSVSGRVFVAQADSVKIADVNTLTEVASIPVGTAIASLYVTPDEANILLQDSSNNLQFIAGADRKIVDSIAAPAPFEHLVGLNINTPAESGVTVLFGAYENKLRQYERRIDGTITFVREIVDTSFSSYNTVIFDQFQAIDDQIPNKSIYAFSNAVNGIVKIKSQMVDQSTNGIYYNNTLGFRTTNLNLEQFTNEINSELRTVVYDKDAGNLILFITGQTSNRAVCLRYFDLTTVWNVEIDHVPNSVSRPTMRYLSGRKYSYIAESGVYVLNMDTGASELIGEIGQEFSAPAFQSGQYFDGNARYILYVDEDGNLSKLFTDRKISDDPSLASILSDIFHRALLEPSDYDVSNLDQLHVKGYIIHDQETAQNALDEIQTFYNLTLSDAGGRVLVNILENGAVITIDDALMVANVERQHLISDISDLYKVTVEYFDTAQDGEIYQQHVTRDLFRPEENTGLTNLNELVYSVNIFTDSTTARRSAELYMMRQLQRKEALSLLLGPRSLAIEPTDIIKYAGLEIRCKTLELDVSYQLNISGESEDSTIYKETPQLLGVNYASEEEVITDQDIVISNYPVLFNLPLAKEGLTEGVYIGQTNPDDAPSEMSSMYIRGPNSAATALGPVTQPVALAELTQLPTSTTAPFTLDRDSVIKMLFHSDIPAGLLSSCQMEDLYESYERNLLFVGDELIQYRDVSITGREATFTNLFRGRFGTDRVMNDHVLGERCVAYSPDSLLMTKLPIDALINKEVTGLLFSEGSTAGSRSSTLHFKSQFEKAWTPQNLRIRKNTFGIFVKASGRSSIVNTFKTTNDSTQVLYQQLPTSEFPIRLFVLSDSVWNPEEFKTMFSTLNFSYAPLSAIDTLDPGGEFFDSTQMDTVASVDWEGDLIFVAVAVDALDENVLRSEPVAFFFDHRVKYSPSDPRFIRGKQLYGV